MPVFIWALHSCSPIHATLRRARARVQGVPDPSGGSPAWHGCLQALGAPPLLMASFQAGCGAAPSLVWSLSAFCFKHADATLGQHSSYHIAIVSTQPNPCVRLLHRHQSNSTRIQALDVLVVAKILPALDFPVCGTPLGYYTQYTSYLCTR